jgi:alkylation response protein AidB-like acyl-CoA dehydrogenase
MRFYVHEFLFKGALNMFGTDEQKAEWLPKIEKCQVLGCFAMVSLKWCKSVLMAHGLTCCF